MRKRCKHDLTPTEHLSGDKVTVDLTALTGLNVTSALPQALNAG